MQIVEFGRNSSNRVVLRQVEQEYEREAAVIIAGYAVPVAFSSRRPQPTGVMRPMRSATGVVQRNESIAFFRRKWILMG